MSNQRVYTGSGHASHGDKGRSTPQTFSESVSTDLSVITALQPHRRYSTEYQAPHHPSSHADGQHYTARELAPIRSSDDQYQEASDGQHNGPTFSKTCEDPNMSYLSLVNF